MPHLPNLKRKTLVKLHIRGLVYIIRRCWYLRLLLSCNQQQIANSLKTLRNGLEINVWFCPFSVSLWLLSRLLYHSIVDGCGELKILWAIKSFSPCCCCLECKCKWESFSFFFSANFSCANKLYFSPQKAREKENKISSCFSWFLLCLGFFANPFTFHQTFDSFSLALINKGKIFLSFLQSFHFVIQFSVAYFYCICWDSFWLNILDHVSFAQSFWMCAVVVSCVQFIDVMYVLLSCTHLRFSYMWSHMRRCRIC